MSVIYRKTPTVYKHPPVLHPAGLPFIMPPRLVMLLMLLAVLLMDLTVLLTVCFQNALILFWEPLLSAEPAIGGAVIMHPWIIHQ